MATHKPPSEYLDIYFQFEVCDGNGTELRTKLSEHYEHKAIPSDAANKIAYQLCKGLYAIHSRDLMHRDVAARNILYKGTDTTM